jgi:hypothetical protein
LEWLLSLSLNPVKWCEFEVGQFVNSPGTLWFKEKLISNSLMHVAFTAAINFPHGTNSFLKVDKAASLSSAKRISVSRDTFTSFPQIGLF